MANNFQSITESPEKLAEFLDNLTERCSKGDSWCIECPLRTCCDDSHWIFGWLQEEPDD